MASICWAKMEILGSDGFTAQLQMAASALKIKSNLFINGCLYKYSLFSVLPNEYNTCYITLVVLFEKALYLCAG